MHRICLGLSILLATAACSQSRVGSDATQARQQCFWASQITGFSDAGPDRALVRAGFRGTWELTLSPGCPDVDWALRIGIRSRGSERICSGANAELLVPRASGSGFERCLVRSVRKLSPSEAAAAAGETPKP